MIIVSTNDDRVRLPGEVINTEKARGPSGGPGGRVTVVTQ